jgi:hypothetical protein
MLASSSASAAIGLVAYLAIVALEIAAWWKIFVKADRPGWGAIIPFSNVYLMCKVANRPGWWLIPFLIPIVLIDLAKALGRGTGFGVLMVFFGFICAPILGFGSATYDATVVGPGAVAP